MSLAGPINDSTDTTGGEDQLLSSDAAGEVTWKDEADLNVHSAQKVIQTVRFSEAVSKGDPVYIDTYNVGQDIQVVGKADASDPNKMPAYGIANDDYGTNATGNITAVGSFNGTFDTSTLTEKAVVYVAPGGGLTSTKPIGTNLIQNIGFCSRSNANNGELEVVAIGRTNDLPNLQEGYIWKGDANGVPQAVSELANSPWEQSGTAIIKQGRDENNYGTPGANAIDGSNSTVASTTRGATGSNSTAFGISTTASGSNSTALGSVTIASGLASTAMGGNTIASANYATASGDNVEATGVGSLAVGIKDVASKGIASGTASVMLGKNNLASGDYSIAIGLANNATANYALATGQNSDASAAHAFAHGLNSTASGIRSFSNGWGTTASGANAWAGGKDCIASGDRSFAFGLEVNADDANMVAFGKYNKLNTGNNSVFQIGVGANDGARDNAFDIHQNGIILMSVLQQSTSYANDGAAQAGGVPIGGLYRNGNVVQIRIV